TGLVAALDLDLRSHADGSATGVLPVAEGVVDGGLLAILADIVGGTVAIRAAAPCGISTTSITVLSIAQDPGRGELRASGAVVHRTRSSATVDVTFTSAADPSIQGVAIVGFRIWEADGSLEPAPNRDKAAGDRSLAGEGRTVLDRPSAELASIGVDPAARSATVELDDNVSNHIGALLGGVMATLLESAARSGLGPGDRLRSMAVSYFAQARVGPVVATASASTPSVISVEAVDVGAERRVAHAVFHHGPNETDRTTGPNP
ncbi:MAG: hypothetical protein OES57_10490, partial [Acidimicrobiia bacterium]|nr:hypothetical protein [Acidimicrobiia bacterium]